MQRVVGCVRTAKSIILQTNSSISMSRVDEIMISFGKNVQLYRKAMNISQEELAFRAELNRTYIGMVERAERNISLKNAKKIADALNVKLDTLLEYGKTENSK